MCLSRTSRECFVFLPQKKHDPNQKTRAPRNAMKRMDAGNAEPEVAAAVWSKHSKGKARRCADCSCWLLRCHEERRRTDSFAVSYCYQQLSTGYLQSVDSLSTDWGNMVLLAVASCCQLLPAVASCCQLLIAEAVSRRVRRMSRAIEPCPGLLVSRNVPVCIVTA